MASKTELKWDRWVMAEKIERQQKELANIARQRDELLKTAIPIADWLCNHLPGSAEHARGIKLWATIANAENAL